MKTEEEEEEDKNKVLEGRENERNDISIQRFLEFSLQIIMTND